MSHYVNLITFIDLFGSQYEILQHLTKLNRPRTTLRLNAQSDGAFWMTTQQRNRCSSYSPVWRVFD